MQQESGRRNMEAKRLGTDKLSLSKANFYVAGITGLIGSAVKNQLERGEERFVTGLTSTELDLRDYDACLELMQDRGIDVLVMAAGKVGGIQANDSLPVDFINENVRIQTNLFMLAHALEIPRVLYLASSCVYPKHANQPMQETDIFSGGLEETSRAYATAKLLGLEQVRAYRKQFKKNWISAIPSNVYGPGDDFDSLSGHVIPSLLLRFHKAVQNKEKSLMVFGTGMPVRDFIYVEDLAKAIEVTLNSYDHDDPINLGTGIETSISSLVEIIAKVTGFKGEITWDKTKSDGAPRKVLDSTKIHDLGWRPKIDILTGLRNTYDSIRDQLG